jgi:uncharacterized membrane protein
MTGEVIAMERGGETGMAGVLPRMGIALLALIGLFVSVYLLLYKLGYIGTLACAGDGGCQTVQVSRWASLFGIPVAAYGVLGYLAILGLALAGIAPGREADRRIAAGLLVLGGGAFAFSVYLTALEAFVIHAWCRWCVFSAVLATLLFALSLLEVPRLRRPHG